MNSDVALRVMVGDVVSTAEEKYWSTFGSKTVTSSSLRLLGAADTVTPSTPST